MIKQHETSIECLDLKSLYPVISNKCTLCSKNEHVSLLVYTKTKNKIKTNIKSIRDPILLM